MTCTVKGTADSEIIPRIHDSYSNYILFSVQILPENLVIFLVFALPNAKKKKEKVKDIY